jgi:sugar O-acyltransferase (sialic acid O-acetyltransferase NeuD family)
MSAPLIIVGAGGHGRVVAEIAAAAGRKVIGFLDAAKPATDPVNGIPVLGKSLGEIRTSHPPARTDVFIAVGENRRRQALFEGALALGYEVPALIHPGAIVSPSATVGLGTVLMAGAIVNANTSIGRYCIINTAASLDHDNRLEDGVQICPGVRSAGTVRFGALAFVGTGATIIPGVTIGANATIGAGSVVIRDVPEDARVAGNPAKPIGH